jgi:hypothetical protein
MSKWFWLHEEHLWVNLDRVDYIQESSFFKDDVPEDEVDLAFQFDNDSYSNHVETRISLERYGELKELMGVSDD